MIIGCWCLFVEVLDFICQLLSLLVAVVCRVFLCLRCGLQSQSPALGRADQVVGVVEAVRVPGVVHLVVQRLVGGRQGVNLFLEVVHLGVKVTPRISTGCKEKLLNL